MEGGLKDLPVVPTPGWLKPPQWLKELPYVGRLNGTPPLREYPVDGGLYPVGGLTPLTPPLKFDRPLPPLLPAITPVERFTPECSKLRLRIEDAPLLATWEVNPLDEWDVLAVAFPICLLAGSTVPKPLVLGS